MSSLSSLLYIFLAARRLRAYRRAVTVAPDIPGSPEKSTGWRGSRAVWLEAARAALITGGVDAVKIAPLASGLNLSRTSFYWFFTDRQDLLNALVDDWEETNTGAVCAACAAYAASLSEAALNLIGVFLDRDRFEPRLDFALRGWAHQSDAIAARVAEADRQRLNAIRAMLQRFGIPADEADVRARTIYLTQIGYISMQVEEPLDLRLSRIPAYVKTFTGQPPSAPDMARFLAQHRLP